MQRIMKLVFPLIAIIMGVILIIVGANKIATKDLYDSTVTATVVDVQEEWDNTGEDSQLVTKVYITYEVDGVKYENVEAPESNAGAQIGDTMEILYQSKDPSKYSGKNITGSATIAIVVGIVVVLAGIIVEIRTIIAKR